MDQLSPAAGVMHIIKRRCLKIQTLLCTERAILLEENTILDHYDLTLRVTK